MPTPAHRRARIFGTVGAAVAHGALAILAQLELLEYTVPTRYPLIDEVASDWVWAWIHALIALGLLVSLKYQDRPRRDVDSAPWPAVACSVAFAAMVTWAFFNLLWGLSAVRPVSLAGPVLAFVVGAGEHLLAAAWNRGSHNRSQ